MAQVLVRGLDAQTVKRLKERAAQHRRSLEAELREILERAARSDMTTARQLAEELRRKLAGRPHSDSAELLAEDRAR